MNTVSLCAGAAGIACTCIGATNLRRAQTSQEKKRALAITFLGVAILGGLYYAHCCSQEDSLPALATKVQQPTCSNVPLGPGQAVSDANSPKKAFVQYLDEYFEPVEKCFHGALKLGLCSLKEGARPECPFPFPPSYHEKWTTLLEKSCSDILERCGAKQLSWLRQAWRRLLQDHMSLEERMETRPLGRTLRFASAICRELRLPIKVCHNRGL